MSKCHQDASTHTRERVLLITLGRLGLVPLEHGLENTVQPIIFLPATFQLVEWVLTNYIVIIWCHWFHL